MKIPTILGLLLLLVATSLGIFLYIYKQKTDAQKKLEAAPINLQVVNITDTEASIIWQTKIPTQGFINWGHSNKLDFKKLDDRDKDQLTPHLIHFVTIKDLQPDSSYFFTVKVNNFIFPEISKQFKTTKTLDNQFIPFGPIIGTVLDQSLQPLDEGLISLKVLQGSNVGTFVTNDGNYLLPLTQLRDQTLSKQFTLSNPSIATLVITRGNLTSNVKVTIPQGRQALPPIILGQDLDFSAISPQATDSNLTFDLNGDGLVNALDLSIVLNNIDKEIPDPITDLNQDGIVNNQDLELIKKELGQNSIN